ncbi:hypothetical protein M422DRAFT_265424 [Sphaerobolus stellatus SS14]|uniref:Uncharacterized protein n=1 Tax=Sphaerobolus stellatus (strain SS14) TaxID=990650 RepID=A0A0C9V5W9_SPHS4|nr:hypothetical protein M422DRAFT_265424 [Sphaerobolus stellatus SS14]
MPLRWTREVQYEWLVPHLRHFQKAQAAGDPDSGIDTFVKKYLERPWFKRFPENIETWGIDKVLAKPLPEYRPTEEEANSMPDPEPDHPNPKISTEQEKPLEAARQKTSEDDDLDAPQKMLKKGLGAARKKKKKGVQLSLAPVGAAVPATRIVAPRPDNVYMSKYKERWEPTFLVRVAAAKAAAKTAVDAGCEVPVIHEVSIRRQVVEKCWAEEIDEIVRESVMQVVNEGKESAAKERDARDESRMEAKRVAKEEGKVLSRTPEEYQQSISVMGHGLQNWIDRCIEDTGGMMLVVWMAPVPKENDKLNMLVSYNGPKDELNQTYMEWRGETDKGDLRGFVEGVVTPFGQFGKHVFTQEIRDARCLVGGSTPSASTITDLELNKDSTTIVQQVQIRDNDATKHSEQVTAGQTNPVGTSLSPSKDVTVALPTPTAEKNVDWEVGMGITESEKRAETMVNGTQSGLDPSSDCTPPPPEDQVSAARIEVPRADDTGGSAKLAAKPPILPSIATLKQTLETLKYGSEWTKLVEAWDSLEKSLVIDTSNLDKLSSEDRLEALKSWIDEGMPLDFIPKWVRDQDSRIFADECKKWWLALQPEGWKDSVEGVSDGAWQSVRVGGTSGIVLLLVVLWWWRSKTTGRGVKGWKGVINEVTTVLIGAATVRTVDEAEAPTTTGNRPRARAVVRGKGSEASKDGERIAKRYRPCDPFLPIGLT